MDELTPDEVVEWKRQRRLCYLAWCWVTTKEQLDRMALNIVLTQRKKQ